MANYHENDAYPEDFALLVSELRDFMDFLPSEEAEEVFDWNELLECREVLQLAVNQIPIIDYLEHIDPLNIGLPTIP